jgi:hypothetical protein
MYNRQSFLSCFDLKVDVNTSEIFLCWYQEWFRLHSESDVFGRVNSISVVQSTVYFDDVLDDSFPYVGGKSRDGKRWIPL